MELFTTTFHIILCVFLILIILLQPGKDSADIFGGGQSGNRMYGNRSSSNPLNTATNIVAIMFMFTSITLALYSTQSSSNSSIVDSIKELEEEFSNEYFKLDIPKVSVLASDIMTVKVPPKLPEPLENAEGFELQQDVEPKIENGLKKETEQNDAPKIKEQPSE
jgi:protein translocase SecG subunit